jgi:hypothetical protein
LTAKGKWVIEKLLFLPWSMILSNEGRFSCLPLPSFRYCFRRTCYDHDDLLQGSSTHLFCE